MTTKGRVQSMDEKHWLTEEEGNTLLAGISSHIGSMLEQLVDQGFTPPLVLCSVGSNGDFMVFRYQRDNVGEWDAVALAEHGEGITTPINFFFADSTGRAGL